MLAMQSRIAALLKSVLVAVLLGCFYSTLAWAESPCISGQHHMVFPPCTFDGGLLSLDSGSGLDVGGGGGHHTLVFFLGPDIEIICDINCPYSASDSQTGTSSGSLTFTISTTVSGLLIDDLSLTLLDPSVTGTGSISWSLSSMGSTVSGDQTTDSRELIFSTPQSSITGTVDVTLFAGCGPEPCISGDAFIDGVLIGVSLVPEPASLALLGLGLAGLGFSRRRKSN